MSCSKVKLYEFNSPKDLLSIFYPQISKGDFSDNLLESDEFETLKKRFYSEAFFDLSLIAKLVVFVKENQIVIVGFEPNCESNVYNRNLKPPKHLKQQKLGPNDCITCVKILPFYYNKSSTIFTFIITGFESGMVRVFNESLLCLYEFKFNGTPVFDIKLFSHQNELNPDQLEQTVLVQYEEFCVKIDGLQLISLLRQNENRLLADQPLSNNVFHELWYLKKNFNDFVYCGLIYEPIYDNLIHQTLFTQDTYFKLKDQRTIKRDLLVTVGNESFLNFYDLNKNESEVTIKGAVTSLVSSFLFGNAKQDEPKSTSNNATLFFNLNKQSSGKMIVKSPNRNLALLYDQLDDDEDSTDQTVSLIDLRRREVIRNWKGYKKCQFSFIEINNSLNKGSEKALFVCLYVPSSKVVEIWPSRFDDKIVSLEVGGNCVLLHHQNLFKAKNLSVDQPCNSIPSTVLFDFDTFTCYTFDISFLCAVTDYKINSRDDLLLKEIPRTINDGQFKKEDLQPILKKLRSPENKLTIMKMMFEKNDLDLIEYTLNTFQQLQLEDREASIEEESLLTNCKFVNHLSKIYTFMVAKNKKLDKFIIKKNILKESPSNITEETENLKWKETDFTRIIPLFIFSEYLNPDDITFEQPLISIQEFMSFFHLTLNTADSVFNISKCNNINLKQENLHKLSTFLFSYLILEDQNLEIIDFFLAHSISALDLIYLLFHAWSINKFTYNWKTWKVLLVLANYLVERYEKEMFGDESLFRARLISCLKQACGLYLASPFIQSAIVGTYTIQVIYNSFCKKEKQTTDYYTTNEDDEWVEISLDEESFTSVLKQLEDIYLLNLLLQCHSSDVNQQISLIDLVKSKNSLTGELVAVHCVRNLIDADVIAKLAEDEDSNSENTEIEINFKTEVDRTLKMVMETDENLFAQLLRHVQLRFPCNLNVNVLLAHCAWQSINKFITNPSIINEVHLKQCLNYLSRIKDPVLRHKMALLIWRAFLVGKFTKINKIIFDEKSWDYSNFTEDLGIEEFVLDKFVSFISDFIEFIFNTINHALNATQINYKKDEWWMPKKNRLLTVEDQQKSIIELALSLRIAKHNVTLIHSQLALLTNLTINYKEKMITSLKTCFPQTVTSSLYSDLHIDLTSDDDNEHLKKCRERILKKFTQNIGRNVPVVTTRMPNDQERKCFRDANAWISKLIDLAQDWNIDSKLIRTNYVFMLYFIGCDVLAKEELYTINDEDFVGRMFMQLIPSRLLTLYGNQIYTKLSLFPNEIMIEIQKMNPKQRVDFEVTFESTKDFIQSCISKLSEGSYHFKTCNSLLKVILQR